MMSHESGFDRKIKILFKLFLLIFSPFMLYGQQYQGFL
jgi:hypothetical protein